MQTYAASSKISTPKGMKSQSKASFTQRQTLPCMVTKARSEQTQNEFLFYYKSLLFLF